MLSCSSFMVVSMSGCHFDGFPVRTLRTMSNKHHATSLFTRSNFSSSISPSATALFFKTRKSLHEEVAVVCRLGRDVHRRGDPKIVPHKRLSERRSFEIAGSVGYDIIVQHMKDDLGPGIDQRHERLAKEFADSIMCESLSMEALKAVVVLFPLNLLCSFSIVLYSIHCCPYRKAVTETNETVFPFIVPASKGHHLNEL